MKLRTGKTHYPHLTEALLQYGRDAQAIAKALGISVRSAQMYLNGESIPKTPLIKRHPLLDEALTKDFASQPKYYPAQRSENSSEIAC